MEYKARDDPAWKTLCVSYTRGNPRTVTSSNTDITLGKDMYGAGVDTLKAIAQKMSIEKLVFSYGPSRDALSLSVRVFFSYLGVYPLYCMKNIFTSVRKWHL